MTTALEEFYELSYYTLAHPDLSFIQQHVVDAFAAQTASDDTKRIEITFALIGLYLYLERGYTGKQVQLAHMSLAKRNKEWPKFALPKLRGEVTSPMFWPRRPVKNETAGFVNGACRCGKALPQK